MVLACKESMVKAAVSGQKVLFSRNQIFFIKDVSKPALPFCYCISLALRATTWGREQEG